MMVCRQCGTANESTLENCRRCGAPLHATHMRGKIPCHVHANREATTTCNGCGARLCDACAYTVGGIDFCEQCAPEGAIATEHDEDYEKLPVLNAKAAERADFDSRFIAGVIDSGIMLVVYLGLWLILGLLLRRWDFVLTPSHYPGAFYFLLLVFGVFLLAYQIVLIAMGGQTIGKQRAGVIILNSDGTILSLGQAIGRGLASVLSFAALGLGYLWVMWDKDGETWHDKIAHTAAFRYMDVN